MIGWLMAWGVSYLFGAGWTFVGCLGLAVFFPRLTQLLFATIVFPVYTLFFGTWAFLLGWMFGWHEFAWEAWKSCASWAAIPVGLVSWYLARGVREIGIDRLRGE
jgi:hypothetical protein